jgi:hypothetical protein
MANRTGRGVWNTRHFGIFCARLLMDGKRNLNRYLLWKGGKQRKEAS